MITARVLLNVMDILLSQISNNFKTPLLLTCHTFKYKVGGTTFSVELTVFVGTGLIALKRTIQTTHLGKCHTQEECILQTTTPLFD